MKIFTWTTFLRDTRDVFVAYEMRRSRYVSFQQMSNNIGDRCPYHGYEHALIINDQQNITNNEF